MSGDATEPSLLDAIREAMTPAGPRCAVRTVVASLSPKDAATFAAVIPDHSITVAAIGRVLRARGSSVGDDALRRHRNQECACSR